MRNVHFAVSFTVLAVLFTWDWQPINRILVALFCGLMVMYELTLAKELDEPEPPSFTGHRYGFGAVFLGAAFGYLAHWSGAFYPTTFQAVGLGVVVYFVGFAVGYAKGLVTLRRAGFERKG
jgi:hypothetical protein